MTGSNSHLVVIGGGQAGFQVAASVRSANSTCEITVLSDENSLPYQRPPLSKAFLLGKTPQSGLWLQPESFYLQKRIKLFQNAHVRTIERKLQQVVLDDGNTLTYDHLVIATGSRPRRLSVASDIVEGIFYLRDLKDALALKSVLPSKKSALVIGGGFIGLEFAAVAASSGLQVTVVEAGLRLMARATSTVISTFFEAVHEARGARVIKGAAVQEVTADGSRATGVRLSNGQAIQADFILVGVGALANDELAAGAGLATADGVHVDANLQTADPHIYAIGDCARVFKDHASFRMESVQNAVDQAKHVGRVLGGLTDHYAATPWFWSDQYEFKLQIAGIPHEFDQSVVRGEVSGGNFSVYHFRQRELIAVESVNQPAAHVVARKLLERGGRPTPENVANLNFDLRSAIPLAA